MNAIYGIYDSAESAQRGFDGLRTAGFGRRDILVLSSEPHEEFEFGRQDNKTVMPWIAAGGAALGLTGAYLLTSLTQQDLPLITGGMPVVTRMTNLIILFELTMLGAIVATVVTLIKTAGFFNRVPEYYDPVVTEGKIVIGVVRPDAMKVSIIERALRSSSPHSLRTR
jgi:hypothetical protein